MKKTVQNMKKLRLWTVKLLLAATLFLAPTQQGKADPDGPSINTDGMVRLVYWRPSDRPHRPDRVEALRQLIKDAQRFFAEQMESHGFGQKTFTVETDEDGEPVVHEIDGKFNERYYYKPVSDFKVWEELLEYFSGDDLQHVYFIAIDLSYEILDDGNSCGLGGVIFHPTQGDIGFGPAGKAKLRHRHPTRGEEALGGFVLIPASGHCFEDNRGWGHRLRVTTHELGHAFGLDHDFREGQDSYAVVGGRGFRLSKCAAEWLSVTRFFNTKSTFRNEPGEIQFLSLRTYGRDVAGFRFRVRDPDGLHQAQLLVPDILNGTGWGPFQLFDCKQLNGKTGIVESVVRTAEIVDRVTLQIIDVGGNITWATFLIQLDEAVPASLDVNSDGSVNILDLVPLAPDFGQPGNDSTDVNADGVVDIMDVLLVASIFSSVPQQAVERFNPAEVQKWLTLAKQIEIENEILKNGIVVLERLLAVLTAVVVDIPDANLRADIENELGVASGTQIFSSDMETLTRIEARNANISDLTGLEHATNLTWLWLGDREVAGKGWVNSNSIKDLSPLAGLTNLTWLNLSQNNITDISPLVELTNLTWLDIGGNNLSNISPVAGLTNLTSLRLWRNNIVNISPVADLTRLTELNFNHNNITDISTAAGLTNLTRLRLRDNNISDLSPLVENAGLGEWRHD